MKRYFSPGLAMLLMLAVSSTSFGQVLVQRKADGTEARGAFVSMSKTELVIKPQVGNEVKIPANDIAHVEWPSAPPDVKLARGFEESGYYDRALERYQTALSGATDDNLRKSLTFLVARASAGLAKTDPTKLDDAIQKLEQFKSANGNHYRYYDNVLLLGELYLQKKNIENAQEAFTELGTAPWKETQMLARIQQGNIELAQENVDQALTIYKEVAETEATTPPEKARKLEAMFGQANCLYQKQSYPEAISVLDNVSQSASEQNETLHARVYLRKGDCFRAEGKDKDALMAYLHVDMLFFKQPDLHAEALYHLAQLWGKVGKPARADECKSRLQKSYEDSEWAKKLGG